LTDDDGGSVQIELQNGQRFSEGFMLEGGSYRQLNMVAPTSGLLGLEAFGRQELRCRFVRGNVRMQPVNIAERLNVDENLCAGWYEIQGGQEYTLTIQLNGVANVIWRPPTQVLLEGEFVASATVTASCQDDQLNAWEGCVDPRSNFHDDGCSDCRCTRPRELQMRDWHGQDTEYLGCHHGRREALFEFTRGYGRTREQPGMAYVAEAPALQIGDEAMIDCWVVMRWNHEDENHEQRVGRNEELSTANECIVLFDPDEGYHAEFFAVLEGEPPTDGEFSGRNPYVTHTVGQRMDQGGLICPAEYTNEVRELSLCRYYP